MLNKRHLRRSGFGRLFSLSLKSVIPMILFVLALLFALLPLMLYFNYKVLGFTEDFFTPLIQSIRRIIPFSSVLLPMMFLSYYTETDCKELLNIYMSIYRIPLCLAAFTVTVIISGVYFVYFQKYYDCMFEEYLKCICACFMLFGVAYLIHSFTKSTAITLLAVLVYVVFLMISLEKSVFNFATYNFEKVKETLYWPALALIGTAGLILGEIKLVKVKE